MPCHFYLKKPVPVRRDQVQSGKSTFFEHWATIGKTLVKVQHDAQGFYLHSSEFEYDGGPTLCSGISSELAENTEYLTYSSFLPTGCLREAGCYEFANASAQVTDYQARSEKLSKVFVTAPNFESLRKLWQVLLDGSIRPERPLFNKIQEGLSYSELATAVADMTPQLKHAMLKLGEAESVIIHLKAVVRSCSQVLQGQMRTIADLQGALAVAEHQRQRDARQISELRSWVK